jgi:hypothetical protein
MAGKNFGKGRDVCKGGKKAAAAGKALDDARQDADARQSVVDEKAALAEGDDEEGGYLPEESQSPAKTPGLQLPTTVRTLPK